VRRNRRRLSERALIPLWRGTLRCDPTDDKETKLIGRTWTNHGKLVADATQYIPSSFHRPRNPAEKISSGYKATEYFLDLFGLGPGFFRVILPKYTGKISANLFMESV
jgi:hypothetical protein